METFFGFRLVIKMINLTRVFAGYLNFKINNESHIELFHTISSSNVTFMTSSVQKIVLDHTRFDALIVLYETIKKIKLEIQLNVQIMK